MINKQKRYTLFKIDMLDSIPNADFYDDDKYVCVWENDDINIIMDTAINSFFKDNPQMKTYEDWMSKAEDGAYEYIIAAGSKTIFRSSLILSDPHIMGALLLIRQYHADQKRKGDGFPYLEHPLEVGYRLWKMRYDSDVVIAGFAHDLLEDTKCSEEEIVEHCGFEVLRIVKAVSNDELLSANKDWEKKKEDYIESVKKGGEKAIAVSIMDKICNLNSLFGQYEIEGPEIWKKFNRGKDKKLWFEKKVYEMAEDFSFNNKMLDEYKFLIEKLEKII